MNLLAIDTSTELATVALTVDNTLYFEEQGSMRQHAQLLLPMIQRLLIEAGISFKQLDGIVFGRGPGSFTGLRIACSVAKGLAYAHDLPMYPVSSLAAIANDVYQTEKEAIVLAMIDARMHQLYWACFTNASYEVQEQVSSPADIKLPSTGKLILAGIGLESYLSQLPENIQAQITTQCTIAPNATAMIRLVQGNHIKPVSAQEAMPVYVRNQVTHGAPKGEAHG